MVVTQGNCLCIIVTDPVAGASHAHCVARRGSGQNVSGKGQREGRTGEQTIKEGDVGSKYVYLAQHVETQTVGSVLRNTMRWRSILAENFPIKVLASYVDELQRGAPQTADEIFHTCSSEIELKQADALLADLSAPGKKYVRALVEIGYALALGIPVVIYDPLGTNEKITSRKMFRDSCTVVGKKSDAAYALAKAISSR